ncbi:MAG: hypothetical protein HC830_01410 [Bacteroidetes bacterium]|nr:hypothetical protein [Bacteroidota bacterium]
MKNTKRKKPNQFNSQEAARHKNMYFQKLLEVASALTTEDVSKLFNKEVLNQIYEHRCRLIKVVADERLNLTSDELKEVKDAILYKLKSNLWKIKNTGKEVVLYDFAGPGLSLLSGLNILQKKEPEKYARLISAFSDFMETPESLVDLQKIIYSSTNLIGWELTEPDRRYVSLKVTYKIYKCTTPYIYIEVMLNVFPTETVSVNLDGNVRSAFRVGLTSNDSEPIWAKMNAQQLGIDHLAADTIVPVYIQKHALNRLKERIDCAEHFMILLNLVVSLEKGKVVNYRGNRLIEFQFLKNKIGYLLIDIKNDIAVIRTFLILTHFDTPEGDNLHRIIGLEKPDITYLNLDKLSTFVLSNIRKKPVVRDLFTRAGCEKLLEVVKKDFERDTYTNRAETIEAYLLKYQEHKEQLNMDSLINFE